MPLTPAFAFLLSPLLPDPSERLGLCLCMLLETGGVGLSNPFATLLIINFAPKDKHAIILLMTSHPYC